MEWDVFSKTLLKKHIQDFVDYFTPGAKVVRLVEGQLQTRVDGSFEPREIRCDVVAEVELAEQNFLEHFECQSTRQTGMAKRMLGYGYELERDHELYSLSAAVYTKPLKNLPERILTWSIPCSADGERREVLRYEHEVLDVCNTPVEEFRKLNKDGFRPLMLLAKGGATTAVLDEVLDTLHEHDCPDALAIAIVFASRVLTAEKDLEHLKRRRNMLDPYIKETAIYRWHCEEMDQDKLAESFAEGREEGREEEARQAIETFVEMRFPDLLAWVKGRIQQISDLTTLHQVRVALFRANTTDEIKEVFAI